jgi:pimeloyl-ACP methyl ester carboxylesterase
MVGKLRAWHAPEALYVFGYDWRRDIQTSAAQLAAFCAEIEGRLRALGRQEPLHLIGHSMGALVVRSALALRNAQDPFAGIGRVIFIAPPFAGALGAVRMLVAGERDGWFGVDEDYRHVARTFPSVYSLVPSYAGAAVDEHGRDVDLLDPRRWQANVREGGEFRADFLSQAAALRRGGKGKAPLLLADAALAAHADRVLVLQGVGLPTPRQLPVRTRNAKNPNWCDFEAQQADPLGDGRVHLESSAVAGVLLAAYTGAADHGRVCRDSRVINTVSMFLAGKRPLRLRPRGPDDPVRRTRRYFEAWDGDVQHLAAHVA